MFRWLAALWLLLVGIAVQAADGPIALPHLAARVTDLTATLSSEQLGQLETSLAAIEQAKGAQVAILLLPTVQPETIEQFGIRLAEAWKIGRKDVNDGVIIIVAKNDRKVRIEVGYGLEGAIPDAIAKRIIEEIVTPRFRQGDFFGGLQEATDALAKIIAGEALPPPADAATNAMDAGDDPTWLIVLIALGAPILHGLLGLLGSFLAAGITGWLAMTFLGSWFWAIVAGLFAFLWSFGKAGGGGSPGSGGFSSSGSGGGGFSGGSDFSGGGGSFGGGGSSGSW